MWKKISFVFVSQIYFCIYVWKCVLHGSWMSLLFFLKNILEKNSYDVGNLLKIENKICFKVVLLFFIALLFSLFI